MMLYLLFESGGFEPVSPSESFLGVFSSVEEAQAAFKIDVYGGGEICSFDGATLFHVCSYPHWKRHDPPQIPIGYVVQGWGVSDK